MAYGSLRTYSLWFRVHGGLVECLDFMLQGLRCRRALQKVVKRLVAPVWGCKENARYGALSTQPLLSTTFLMGGLHQKFNDDIVG